jgi:transposase
MQGEKRFEPKLFYGINLSDFIGTDHFLMKLNDAISLEWIRERTRSYYSHTGKPSVDPVVLVKMLLVGYLYDIRSERRLVEEVRLNLAYRWYAGYERTRKSPTTASSPEPAPGSGEISSSRYSRRYSDSA